MVVDSEELPAMTGGRPPAAGRVTGRPAFACPITCVPNPNAPPKAIVRALSPRLSAKPTGNGTQPQSKRSLFEL